MTTDYSKCEDSPEVPELPETGMGETIGAILGLGSLTTVGAAYLASRRGF
jgi:LPXTG-motif cell wall-anchored protein